MTADFQAIGISRLFDIGPRVQSLSFANIDTKCLLETFVIELKNKLGGYCTIRAFPQRIFNQESWKVYISGELNEIHLLLNVTGRYHMPDLSKTWPARLNIELSDHIDAFWLIQFLAHHLPATLEIPADLSTAFGDKVVGKGE